MSYFDQVIAKLFHFPEKVKEGKLPLVSGIIERNLKFFEKYHTWLNSDEKDSFTEAFRKEFDLASESGSDLITRLNSPGAVGFLMHGEGDQIAIHQAEYLMEYWKDQILKLTYKLYSSHSENFLRYNSVILRERYYLKPVIRNLEPPVSQEYGNVLIEMEINNDRLIYLKFLVTYYTGFNYRPALPYDDLVRILF
jgi:hypothetical protein